MPDKLSLWLTSGALFREAVGLFTDQIGPERLPDQVRTPHGWVLNRVDAVDALPDPPGQGDQAAFLSDSYTAVQAAAGRGWRTAWYNPEGAIVHGELPVQDVDLTDLAGLEAIGPGLARNPSLAQCLDWWEEWDLPENVRRHSKAVAQSAYHLAVLLRDQGVPLDPILTQRGGLLHDIDKISTLQQSGAHGRAGADFLTGQGYPALAAIVGAHIMSSILEPGADQRPWEVRLVYFCDKLVEGDQLVPFDERLAALFERYPHYRETMARAAEPVRGLSDQICSILSIPSHEKLIFFLSELKNN